MTRRTVWHVSVSGKWGGTRSLRVHATTEKQARREASALMRSDESIQRTHNTKEQA
jgi:hypothetical protein